MRKQIRENQFINYQPIKEQLTPLLNRFIVRRTRQGLKKNVLKDWKSMVYFKKFPKSTPDNLYYEVSNQYKAQLLKMAGQNVELTRAFNYEITSLAELKFLAHPLDLFEQYQPRENQLHHRSKLSTQACYRLVFLAIVTIFTAMLIMAGTERPKTSICRRLRTPN